MKRIILCADDYGQNPAISQAIVELLEKKHLSATSCLVTSPFWMDAAHALIPLKKRADIGLHFNLTEGKPLSQAIAHFIPLSQLIMKAQLRQLNQEAIKRECHAQIDQFVAAMGQLPDYLDGHQHVHQFPVIREAVLAVYEERLRAHGAYVRCTDNLLRVNDVAYVKQLIIQLCGARAFKKRLIQQKIPHNDTFAGIYDFTRSNTYPQLFPRFLDQVQTGGLIMCHPGLQDASDVIAAARYDEYQYFCSEQFVQVCHNQQITLTRNQNAFSK